MLIHIHYSKYIFYSIQKKKRNRWFAPQAANNKSIADSHINMNVHSSTLPSLSMTQTNQVASFPAPVCLLQQVCRSAFHFLERKMSVLHEHPFQH
jgi:hypothetical protein